MGWFERALQVARKRELDRIAAAYAVGAWLLVQAASIAFPAFEAPPWLLRWSIAALLVGFPAVLVSVWIIQKPEADPWRFSHFRGRNAAFVLLVALVAMLTLGELAWHSSAAPPAVSDQPTSAPAGSVAVLPFDNMSGDAKQKYFSEGMSAELINLLARNPALRVVARTSSFYFEGKSLDIRTIAHKLNVRTVLEGSVSTDGVKIHIDAALVNAEDGFQIWSQSYDRSLSDILALQSDIAESIARALAPALTGVKNSVPKPAPIDPDTYRDYLQAQFFFDQRLTEGQTPASQDALNRAVELFRKVAASAPDFADGQAGLAQTLLSVENNDELDPEIERALSRALAIDPENPEALVVAIGVAAGKWDWDGVIRNALILKRTAEHTAVGAQGLASAYNELDLLDAAGAKYREWAKIDPFSYVAWAGIARTYFAQARYADVIAASDEALAIHPGDPVTSEYKCVSLASLKRIPEAEAILPTLAQSGIPAQLAFHCEFFMLLNTQGQKAAIAFIHDGLAHGANTGGPGDTGFMLSHADGAFDEAASWYEKSFAARDDWGFNFYPGASPPPAFFQNPRWIALTRQAEYQRFEAARDRARRELLGGNP
jgi:TolB-like protein